MSDYRAIVRHPGNASLFDAVEMSLLALLAGWPLHIHAEGVRGTGKTTVLRAARALLPPMERITGCLYNCRPERPHCPQHRDLSAAELARLGRETVPRPFLEISHSAKLGTVAGSLDLGRLSNANGFQAAVRPGTLPQAHRGVVIVDEINRLAETAPELADILLDAMGTRPGRVQIEESGLPHVAVPVEVVVWAASNPDEDPGPLSDVRRQLSDRFDLNIGLERPPGPEWVERVLALHDERLLGRTGVRTAAEKAARKDRATETVMLAGDLRRVEVPAALRRTIAELYCRFGLESLRAAEGLLVAARALALRAGRQEATVTDLRRAAPLVLRHRLEAERLHRCLQFLDDSGAATAPRAFVQAASDGEAQAVGGETAPGAPERAVAAVAAPSRSTVPPIPYRVERTVALPAPEPGQAITERPLLQRVWQRLSGQSMHRSGSTASDGPRPGGMAPDGSTPGEPTPGGPALGGTETGGAARTSPGAGGSDGCHGGAQTKPAVYADPSQFTPPAQARPLRQLHPERWLAGPEQLWRND